MARRTNTQQVARPINTLATTDTHDLLVGAATYARFDVTTLTPENYGGFLALAAGSDLATERIAETLDAKRPNALAVVIALIAAQPALSRAGNPLLSVPKGSPDNARKVPQATAEVKRIVQEAVGGSARTAQRWTDAARRYWSLQPVTEAGEIITPEPAAIPDDHAIKTARKVWREVGTAQNGQGKKRTTPPQEPEMPGNPATPDNAQESLAHDILANANLYRQNLESGHTPTPAERTMLQTAIETLSTILA